MNEFGEQIRSLRKEQGMTQRQFAQAITIDFTYLSKIETGALPPPSEATIGRMCTVLDVDKDYLLAIARKVPTDLPRILRDAPPEATVIVRALSTLSENQYDRIMEVIRNP